MANTYRRVSECDEDWFFNQTGTESHPKVERCGSVPETTPEVNYSSKIDMSSFHSIGTFSNLGVEESRDVDIFAECNNDEDEEEEEGETDSFKFLERMESSLFNYETKRQQQQAGDESITHYDSDEGSDYDGVPRDENYFGEEARSNFFALYHR